MLFFRLLPLEKQVNLRMKFEKSKKKKDGSWKRKIGASNHLKNEPPCLEEKECRCINNIKVNII